MKSHTSHQHSVSFGPGHNSILSNSKNTGRHPFTTPIPDADDAIRQFLDKVLAFRSSNNLDWNNCCVFNLYKGRDPVVQNPPQWPVSCAASYHAGIVVSDIVSTGNFAKQYVNIPLVNTWCTQSDWCSFICAWLVLSLETTLLSGILFFSTAASRQSLYRHTLIFHFDCLEISICGWDLMVHKYPIF